MASGRPPAKKAADIGFEADPGKEEQQEKVPHAELEDNLFAREGEDERDNSRTQQPTGNRLGD